MRKALVSLTTGYCQSTVACKTRLSCLDFASWLSHQLHHRQPLMKKVIESPGRKLKCKDIRQVLDGLKYSIQTTVTLCFKSKVSSQFPIVLTSTLECFSTISESCFRSSSKYWKLQKKKKKKVMILFTNKWPRIRVWISTNLSQSPLSILLQIKVLRKWHQVYDVFNVSSEL